MVTRTHPPQVVVLLCALLYRTVYSTVVHYLYFEPRMSRSRWKSSDDVAGTAKEALLIFKAQDLNVEQYVKAIAAIQITSQCYRVVYDEGKKELLPRHYWIIFS